MISTTNTISRLTRALVLAVALAAFTAPVAVGDNPSDRPGRGAQTSQVVAPDWFERAALRASRAEAPDWFERAALRASRAEAPDWFERAAARHLDAIAGDKRSPDTIDAALLAQSGRSSVTQLDPRSADTRDAAVRPHTQVVTTVTGHAFDWGDFGLGVVASFGVLLLVLLGAAIMTVRGHRDGRIRST
ncbi:MAG: hypothetical protein HW413_1159 [Thermoleophilia bacterium]|nr:hypothetical protein [Thermoleophilia bacterium]